MDIITLSIPIFFALIGIELLVVYFTKQPFYRTNDSVSDLAAGVLSQLAGIVFKLLSIGSYMLVFKLASVQTLLGAPTIPYAWWSWALCFVLVDLAYYWFHRLSHETALGWSFHVVHHQSEEYNLTVALRQSAFGTLFGFVFYLPIAFIGFPVEMYVSCYAVNLLYQFWIHTRAIHKFPAWFEYVLNTPSHHRVHHGKNPKYCDRNHAGVFMFWDRMFGTFVPEEEEPVYGITVPLNSWSPVWANVGPTVGLFKEMWAARGWDKWRVLFNKPGWRPAYRGPSIVPQEVDRSTYHKYDPPAAPAVNVYILVQFAVLVPITFYTLMNGARLLDSNLPYLLLLSAFIVLSLQNFAALHEGRAWAWFSELGRMLTLAAVCLFAAVTGPPLWGGLGAVLCVGSAVALFVWRNRFAGMPVAVPAAAQ